MKKEVIYTILGGQTGISSVMYGWKIIKIQEACTHFAFSGTARRYQQESCHSTRLAFGSPFSRQRERLSRDIGRCQRRCPSLTFLGIGGAKPRTLTCTASRRELSRGCSHFDVSSWWCTAHPSVTPAPQPLMNSTSGGGGRLRGALAIESIIARRYFDSWSTAFR